MHQKDTQYCTHKQKIFMDQTSLIVGFSSKNFVFSRLCGGSNLGFKKAQPLAMASSAAGPS